VRELRSRVSAEVRKVVVGQDEVVDLLLAAVSVNGHVLLEGVPGVAKTLLANALARALGISFRRVQFTPDMLPSDLTGTMTLRWSPDSRVQELVFRPGPVFTNVLLADEINRTPPKTQAALLEAMEEGRVTIEGQTLDLPRPFVVCATQNPIEFEGTYQLPEAQLDRFLLKLLLDYPDPAAETEILRRYQAGFRPRELDRALGTVEPIVTAADALAMQGEAAAVVVHDDVLAYVAEVAAWLRASPDVIVGPSPRGAIALVLAAKVMAAAREADFVTPDDLQSLAPAVLRHRIVLSADAELGGRAPDDVIASALAAVPVPR
jgi:MoxR-like ATPase